MLLRPSTLTKANIVKGNVRIASDGKLLRFPKNSLRMLLLPRIPVLRQSNSGVARGANRMRDQFFIRRYPPQPSSKVTFISMKSDDTT